MDEWISLISQKERQQSKQKFCFKTTFDSSFVDSPRQRWDSHSLNTKVVVSLTKSPILFKEGFKAQRKDKKNLQSEKKTFSRLGEDLPPSQPCNKVTLEFLPQIHLDFRCQYNQFWNQQSNNMPRPNQTEVNIEKRSYQFVPDVLRQQLFQMVFELNISVFAASQTLDIQYATAKHIVRKQRAKKTKTKASPANKKLPKKKDTPQIKHEEVSPPEGQRVGIPFEKELRSIPSTQTSLPERESVSQQFPISYPFAAFLPMLYSPEYFFSIFGNRLF